MGEPTESPLVAELAGLLAAGQDWVARTAAAHQVATGAAECAGCPFCQLIGALRGDRPELTERVVEVAATLVGHLRGMVDQPAAQPEQPEPSGVQVIPIQNDGIQNDGIQNDGG